jgi:hypothetical protein
MVIEDEHEGGPAPATRAPAYRRGFATLRRMDDERRTRGVGYAKTALIFAAAGDLDLRPLGLEIAGDLSAWVGVAARLEMDDGCWFEGHVTPGGDFRGRLVRLGSGRG